MNDAAKSSAAPKRSDFPPTFIVGCPRSGTTLLASLCDRHSQIAVPPESHFFSSFCKTLPRRKLVFPAALLAGRFVESQYTRDLNLTAETLLKKTGEREISVLEFYRLALDAYACTRGKIRWMEKSAEHLLFADQIFEWYSEARIVCLLRDGRDTALSLRNLPWSITPVRHYGAVWRESAIALLRCQRKWPENFLVIRYESLLTDPVGTLTAVMHFVGLDFEPGQLDPSLGTGVVPAWEMRTKKNVFSEIDPSRAFAWKRTATTNQLRAMNSMMHPYLGRLGYEPGDAHSWWSPVRWFDAVVNPLFRVAFSHKLSWLRWWIRVFLGPLAPESPYASLKESRPHVPKKDGHKLKPVADSD